MAKRKNRKVTANKIRKTEITLTANRKYKDTVFRMLFSDRKNLLSLYNAIKLFVNDYNKVFVYQDKAAKRSLMFDVEKTMNEIYSIL